MDIIQRQTGRVLGPQGSTIKEMQVRFGVKLNIQVSEAAKGGDAEAINKLKMTGSMDAVKISRYILYLSRLLFCKKAWLLFLFHGSSYFMKTYIFPQAMRSTHPLRWNSRELSDFWELSGWSSSSTTTNDGHASSTAVRYAATYAAKSTVQSATSIRSAAP
jgi:hypothetical protein